MSNYTKPERPSGVPSWFYVQAEWLNGTGGTSMWVHDEGCAQAGLGGTTECCTGDLKCSYERMPWQQMTALAMWMIEQADIARDRQLQEAD